MSELNAQPVLVAKNICKTYQDGSQFTEVLHGVDFSVYPGEAVAIVGSSGSGKSTLLHILGGLDEANEGEVSIDKQRIDGLTSKQLAKLRNQKLGFIYQFHHLLGEFSAIENVAMPLLIAGQPKKVAYGKARSLLERVGLGHRLTHRPAELSGGERQRTAIARALVNEPSLVLADEPTGNLDSHSTESIYQLILELNRDLNTAFVVVTHDLALAAKFSRQAYMQDGNFVAKGE
ncbi:MULTISPECIES: lipoprotein-releasing ABC transporter ATP-binding protein LolD [unclassified Agarivorans]|uniref:lipoprotein-releasing ABC transporter ATP-binding protein LolD n=1 Tax=unclassified Agarivorans TaxID=2636026 RepID=UPI0026E3DBE9|nr:MULTISPECIES: lipoprotein-releasing ABC transporter ATP-binding protein LolD [unclassified Agarivorans]MDO6686391.1 lipoprotein-releasing ABC transporter ATP-binding protein LolD [Agarivorans sp. 3_MG-2023]MDO6713693.1 lipoprotein-releasing ABC transporter ATP-binding protein LolD [Agarivorans sp. 2_MG-2023]